MNCPICGTATKGRVEDASLVIDENIVCKDPVCQRQAMAYLQSRERQLELNLGAPVARHA